MFFAAPTPAVFRSVVNPKKDQRLIRLSGLPRSAKPADVLRLARHSLNDEGSVMNVADAKLEYWRFVPTGRAYISMRSDHYVDAAYRALKKTQMSSLPVRAFYVSAAETQRRMRGRKGRFDAADRAAFDGIGIGGGVEPKGCDVVLYGLPPDTAAPALRLYLKRNRLVGVASNGEPACDVLKVDQPERKSFTSISKHLIRLNSPAEAHAFVRKMHMTYFLPEVWSNRFLLQARVVY
ncbi:uncharacterized protein FOMMEDRAFT_168860 [Fomitiporia mediterranea MF3/22]|uniref:uncharacterized protein n=1 Tax=Fomitiporia mediterranea (strain MF3/22) TaxID=694068 RepID=UPI000440774A|nr:uncharacterized protein FOMMEDRAFT_168860 [Fomitiporia mediterranea MF3/22]EJD02395.1 hypothetical protein FOMMEDRAFT_168860 [Fomitiporia mediterranea MF3/22]